MIVEICVQGLAAALEAGRGGADRVELCEHLAVGGVTPSAGAIAVACDRLAIPIHVLIRPRGGDFVYSDDEFAAMRHDIATARGLDAAGVVLGLLDGEGAIDREGTARLIDAARPLSVTFHKAFDAARDPFEALDVLLGLGVDRVLTSGGAASAAAGLEVLRSLRERAGDRLVILAGGRLTMEDVPTLAAAGVEELHFGSAATVDGRTDAEAVGRLVAQARATAGGTLGPG